MNRPQTIQIFLPDGNPRSIRIADITNQVIQAVLVPRKKLDFISKRSELQNVGLYFLFGSTEGDEKPVVYIGESENCFNRLKEHHKDPKKWIQEFEKRLSL